RQRLQIWASRCRHRDRPPTCATRGLSVAGRPGRDQRHDGRSAGALGWVQVFRCRPRIWPLRHRSVSRNPRHPGGLMSKKIAISPEEAADRLAIRELIEAYARRDAKGQMALFTADTHFVVHMNAKDP